MQALGIGSYYFELEAYGRAAEVFRDLVERAKTLRRAWMTRWGTVELARSLLHARAVDPGSLQEIKDGLRVLGERVPHGVSAEILLAEGQVEAALKEAESDAVDAKADDRSADLLYALELEGRALLELGRASEALPLRPGRQRRQATSTRRSAANSSRP